MSLLSPVLIPSRWDRYRQRSFWRLVDLFSARIFRGGGDADAEGLDLGIGLVLTLLAMPGGFVSLLLLNKYASFLQWLRGMTNVDPLSVSFPDEYFFIVLSMTVTGAVAVWRWDAIFPDRRDYINLVHLPISTRTIFFANLIAVLFLIGLIAIDVNAASCVLFPMVVAAMQTHFLFFLEFAFVHATAVVLSSVFSFFTVFSFLGVLMAVLPVATLKRVSTYVRGLIVVYLVTLLCTSFAVPYNLARSSQKAPLWAYLFPSSWFLSLCQVARGRATPALVELSHLALPAFAACVGLALVTYAIGYRRHFIRIPEMAETSLAAQKLRPSRIFRLLQLFALRTPFLRGCFPFVWKTLLRTEMHRLVVTAAAGLGLVLASQAAMNAVQATKTIRQAALSPDAISIPYILTFLLIIGLRVVFEIPTDLRSNWIFQLLLDRDHQECASLARNTILSVVLPLVFFTAFPLYFYLEGPRTACLHALIVAVWAVLLTNIVLVGFRKLPFTCTMPLFKQHSIVILLCFVFGYLIYAVSIPEFESSALSQPVRLLGMIPVIAIAALVPRFFARNTPEIERRLIFEESAGRNFELLRLSE
jgi:hypothetical protein